MNKAQLIDIVSEKAGISKKEAKDAVETMFTAITQTLKNGEKVKLVGFGRFTVTTRIPERLRFRERKPLCRFPSTRR